MYDSYSIDFYTSSFIYFPYKLPFEPGEFNRMLSGLKLRLSDKHRVNILSKTPYIITIDNFLSNDEADSILATVNDWQEPQMETPDENSNTDADADVDAEEGLDAEKKIAAERQRKTTSVAAQDEAEEEEETTVAEESKATMKNENTATQKKSTTASTQLLSSSSVKKLPASTKTTTTSTSTSTTLRHQPVSTTGQKKKYQPVHETVTDVEKEDEEEEEEEEDEPSNKYSNKPSNKSSNKQLSNKKQAHRRLQEGAPILRIPKSRHGSHAWCMGECAENDEMENMITRLEETIFVPKTHVEHFQLLKFEKGQGYYAHMDADKSERVLPCGPRILSMIVYMTDVRSGGETAFPLLNITVQPKKGRLLLFQNVDGEDPIFEKIDHKISHGSMPVQAGTKIIMKSFVHPFNFVESMKWDCLNHHINMQ